MSRITRTRRRDACDDHDERLAEATAEGEMYSSAEARGGLLRHLDSDNRPEKSGRFRYTQQR
jgi:hypothetical protein